MFAKINDIKIHYKVAGQGKPLILLHGWGAQMTTLRPVQQYLQRSFCTYSVDLPGFGLSDPPPYPWGVAEYADAINGLLDSLELHDPIILGHSFGGKVAIFMAAKGRLMRKLILVDSAGIRAPRTPRYYFKVYSYKLARRVLELPGLKRIFHKKLEAYRNRAGSEDYRNAQGVMRQILVKIVNEDLTGLLPDVGVPTLLVWGELDTATPVSDGKMMEKLIPDAGLVVLPNAGHYSYLDRLPDFLKIIGTFLKSDMEKQDE